MKEKESQNQYTRKAINLSPRGIRSSKESDDLADQNSNRDSYIQTDWNRLAKS